MPAMPEPLDQDCQAKQGRDTKAQEVALDIPSGTESSDEEGSLQAECRICHGDESTSSLDQPCNCTGSMAYAHQSCIQRWIEEKGDKTCEICGAEFDDKYAAPEGGPPDPGAEEERLLLRTNLGRLLHHPRLQVALDAERRAVEAEVQERFGTGFYGYPPHFVWVRTALACVVALLLLRFLLMLSDEEATPPPNPPPVSGDTQPAPGPSSMPAVILIFVLRLLAPLLPFFLMFQAIQALRMHSAQQDNALAVAEMAWLIRDQPEQFGGADHGAELMRIHAFRQPIPHRV